MVATEKEISNVDSGCIRGNNWQKLFHHYHQAAGARIFGGASKVRKNPEVWGNRLSPQGEESPGSRLAPALALLDLAAADSKTAKTRGGIFAKGLGEAGEVGLLSSDETQPRIIFQATG